ncbi:SAM-dependent methyltransferase [Candidatus Parcubacteria bacterium]|nr:MAG: SAM-dependent methyltransferase [Candidatus Parcubacteria bacterium]
MWSKDLERFLNLAKIKKDDKVYDLGCGDGKLLFAAAKYGAKAEGFEVSILPYVIAKVRQIIDKTKVKIKFRDFWMVNLSDADVVFFFLIPRIYPKLKKKLQSELKPGTRVVAYVWPFEDWEPDVVDKAENRPTMYLYTIK